jgi:4-hydroxy-tetrahydrodipicolinate reductase
LSIGLGPIGQASARLVHRRADLELVGAVDVDPEVAGRDLGELLGVECEAGSIYSSQDEALAEHQPDLVILCTSSSLARVRPDILRALDAGANLISPCEELLFPELARPEIAREIAALAEQRGASVLGTGVNPGFVLEFLPVVASGVCAAVDRVRSIRVLDASLRRGPLVRKVGAGLAREEFEGLVAAGKLGHVGMRESVALLAHGLGLAVTEIEQTVEPVLAESDFRNGTLSIAAGRVAGIRDRGVGRGKEGEVLIDLELQMYVGAREARDEIFLYGEPDLHVQVVGGIPGDAATAAILCNSARSLVAATPGLKTVLDLPPPRAG